LFCKPEWIVLKEVGDMPLKYEALEENNRRAIQIIEWIKKEMGGEL